jgi:thermostable 8-oxoguanine DNA glycosylase
MSSKSVSGSTYRNHSEVSYSLGDIEDRHLRLICVDKRNVNMTSKTFSAKQYLRNGECVRLIQTDSEIETGKWATVVITDIKTLGGFVYRFKEV